MKKITDALSGIKNIFSRKENSREGTSAGCVEFKDAGRRTAGQGGMKYESYDPQTQKGWKGYDIQVV